MPNAQLGLFLLALAALLLAAHGLGYVAERARLPRVAGEIAGGLLLGPTLFGHLAPDAQRALFAELPAALLPASSGVGLVLLMFISGFQVHGGLAREDRRLLAPLVLAALGLPFALGFAVPAIFDVGVYRGAADSDLAFALVFAIGFAVTSIPVISRIFIDLGVMDTRFARLVLTTATIEDIVLWVALSVALAVAADAAIDGGHLVAATATTLGFLALSLVLGPRLVVRLAQHRWNALATASPVAFLVLVCFAFAGAATLVDVNPMFGALIAGIIVGRLRGAHFDDARERVRSVGLATLVPLYFALVGFKLDLTAHFDLPLVLALFVGSSAVKMASVWLGAHAAGCSRRAGLNLALAMNARGGPGIVLGSLAYEAGIVDGRLFVALIATALLTSVLSGTWLRHALERGEGSVDDALLPPADASRTSAGAHGVLPERM